MEDVGAQKQKVIVLVRNDVERRTLSAAGALDIDCAFPLDDATRQRFIEGLDDIAITLRHAAAIDGYEARRPDWMPTAG